MKIQVYRFQCTHNFLKNISQTLYILQGIIYEEKFTPVLKFSKILI